MKTVKLLSLLFLVVLFSCGGKNNVKDISGQAERLDFKLETNVKQLDLSYEMTFVRLETMDSCLIDRISQIESKGDTLFLLDANKSALFAFNKEGTFLHAVGNKGNGPGEYIWPSSIYLDISGKILYVVDAGQQKVIEYDSDTFAYLSERKLQFDATCGCPINNGYWLWNDRGYQEKTGNFYYLSTDVGLSVEKHFLEKEFQSGYITGPAISIYQMNGKTYGYTPFSPLIYEFSSERAMPVYSVAYDDYTFPSVEYMNEISNNGSMAYFSKLSESGFISYNMVMGVDGCLLVCPMADGIKYIGFYDLKSGKSDFLRLEDFAGVLKCGVFDYVTSSVKSNCFILPLSSNSLKELEQEGYDYCVGLKTLLPEISEEDNPVLCMMKVRG